MSRHIVLIPTVGPLVDSSAGRQAIHLSLKFS